MKNKKTKLLAVSTLITSLAIGSVLVLTRHSIDTFETDADANYTIVLDKNNAYSSGTTKDIPTVSGHSTVKFSYSNASSESNAHVKLANSGVIANVEQITSIHNFKVDFTGSLQVRTSYDKETWGSYFDLIDEHNYQFDSHPYYFEIKATAQSVINSITVKYTCEANPAIPSGKPTESYYEKVTTASDLVSGQYLIVYDDSKAFNGGLSSLDATSNYISVSVSNNKIAESNNTIAAEFTFDLTQGSIRSASGYYIGRDAYSNGLDTSTTFDSDFSNTISADGGSCDVVAVGGCSLRYNKQSGQNRFRYYKSGQESITFFKKVAGTEPMPTPVDVVSISATDTGSYSTLTSFAASNNLVVKAHKSDGSEVTLSSSDYTAVLRDGEQNIINQNENFTADGTYTLTVTYNGFETSLNITVQTVAVQSISIPSSASVQVGKTTTLTVTFTPSNAANKNVTWESSNQSIATVNDGVITGVNEGTITITATSVDGGHKAYCTLTVEAAPSISKTELLYTYDDYIANNCYALDNCPLEGSPKVLIIPIWFTDSSSFISTSKKASVRSDIEKAYLGTNSETGWRSVKTFYEEESQGAMSLTGTVSNWYECGQSYETYGPSDSGGSATSSLVETATNWYFTNNPSDSKSSYDTNNDGYLDGVLLIYAAPDYSALSDEDLSNLWAYCYWLQGSKGTTSNPNPNVFFWASYDFMYGSNASSRTGQSSYHSGDSSHCTIDAHTFIHEMGHVLGLEDYYDYGPNTYNPAGGFSMQDYNVGGHDPYSVMAYGWADPYIPTESMEITIGDFQSTHDVILLANHTVNSPFDEYILIELFTPTGLNKLDCDYKYSNSPQGPSQTGIRLWHIDARLTKYNSSTDSFSTSLITNPTQGNVYHAMSNTYNDSEYGSVLGSSYYNYNILQLIRNNTSETYRPTSNLSNSALFKQGDTFSTSTYSSQFYKTGGKMNNGNTLGWTFTVTKLSSTSATISVVKA